MQSHNSFNPRAYIGIAIFGKRLGASAEYIATMQRLASDEGAPRDSVFKCVSGRWFTVSDLHPEDCARVEYDRQRAEEHAANLRIIATVRALRHE